MINIVDPERSRIALPHQPVLLTCTQTCSVSALAGFWPSPSLLEHYPILITTFPSSSTVWLGPGCMIRPRLGPILGRPRVAHILSEQRRARRIIKPGPLLHLGPRSSGRSDRTSNIYHVETRASMRFACRLCSVWVRHDESVYPGQPSCAHELPGPAPGLRPYGGEPSQVVPWLPSDISHRGH